MEPKPPKTSLEVIVKALRRRSVISFTYDDKETLVVEPIVLGVHKETGKQVLRCYKSFPLQLSDSADNWYLCEVDKITNLKTTPLRTKDFRKHGKTLSGDLAQVIEFSPDYKNMVLSDKSKKG